MEQSMRGAFGVPVSPARGTTRRQREYVVYAAVMVAIAALSIVANLSAAIGGSVPAAGRVALGLLGLAAGASLWTKPRVGWMLSLAWALIQIPIYAWTPDGSPTAQFINLPLAFTSSVEINGVVTAYSSIGVNLVGVALAIYLRNRRERFD
jgi:hypothetical protein